VYFHTGAVDNRALQAGFREKNLSPPTQKDLRNNPADAGFDFASGECFMARLIEFYRPQGFIPASPMFRPNRMGKVIAFPIAKSKKSA
jgi:hypothetical protein